MAADHEYLIPPFHFAFRDQSMNWAEVSSLPAGSSSTLFADGCLLHRSKRSGWISRISQVRIASCASGTRQRSHSRRHPEPCRCSRPRPSSISQQTPVIEMRNRVERVHREPIAREQEFGRTSNCATTRQTQSRRADPDREPARRLRRSVLPKRSRRHFDRAPHVCANPCRRRLTRLRN